MFWVLYAKHLPVAFVLKSEKRVTDRGKSGRKIHGLNDFDFK